MSVGRVIRTTAPADVWRSVRQLPDFRRLLQVRLASQFADGLFQSALAGALLFNPERATAPMAIAGAFAVLFLPYSLLGPFAGALMDRVDRRLVLVRANAGRLLSVLAVGVFLMVGADDIAVLCAALIANGFSRFVMSGMSAALPHVVPREQVVAMNALATATGSIAAFCGSVFMLVPRWLVGSGDRGAALIIFCAALPMSIALLWSTRFAALVLGPDETKRSIHGSVAYTVITGCSHGVRTVLERPTVAATLAGLAAHRIVFAINTLLVLVLVRQPTVVTGGLTTAVVFVAATGTGSLTANALTPPAVRRWGRYATANVALATAAVVQIAGVELSLPVLVGCGFFLGVAGQTVKLCADTAMQIDVDDARRGHVFAVQDALYWIAFTAAITVAAGVIADDGRSPVLVLAGTAVYLAGLVVHVAVGRRGRTAGSIR